MAEKHCDTKFLAAFISAATAVIASGCNSTETITPESETVRVVEYMPAPGQFINDGFECNTPEEAALWAEQRLRQGKYVSLGAFGGYMTVEIVPPIENTEGKDFHIGCNAYDGSSEPGAVWISEDGSEWFRIKGGERETANWTVTYFRPEAGASGDIKWVDGSGKEGVITHLPAFHPNPYYPLWVKEDEYTVCGPLLEDRSYVDDNGIWHSGNYAAGYADNVAEDFSNSGGSPVNGFDISDAVHTDGTPANPGYARFIKIQTAAITSIRSSVGEMSTEITGIGRNVRR